jgi:Bacterial Ig-like domain
VDYVDEKTPVRAVLKPLEPLDPDTTYRVVVDGADASDMKGVKDASGTPMEATYTFFFTTGTTVEPCNSADITLDPVGIISGTGFTPNSWITLTTVYSPNGETTTWPFGTWVTDATGAFSTGDPPQFTFCYDPSNTSVEVTVTDGADVRVTESFPLNCGI